MPRCRPRIEWVVLTRGGGGFADITAFIAAHPDWPGQTLLRKRAEEQAAGVPDATLLAWFAAHPPMTPAGKLRQADLWLDARQARAGPRAHPRGLDQRRLQRVRREVAFLQRYHGVLRPADHEARLDRLLWDGQREEAGACCRACAPEWRALGRGADGARRSRGRAPSGWSRACRPRCSTIPASLYERVRWRRRKEHYDDAIPLLDSRAQGPGAARGLGGRARGAGALRARRRQAADRLSHRRAARAHDRRRISPSSNSSPAGSRCASSTSPTLAYDHFVRLYDEVKLPISRRARRLLGGARAPRRWATVQLAETLVRHRGGPDHDLLRPARRRAHRRARRRSASPSRSPRRTRSPPSTRRELVRVTRGLAADRRRRLRAPLRAPAQPSTRRTPAEYALRRAARDRDRPARSRHRQRQAGELCRRDAARRGLSDRRPAAAAAPVERPLVLAMTRQESAFDRGAVSSAGARGLMQLMPATASHVAQVAAPAVLGASASPATCATI